MSVGKEVKERGDIGILIADTRCTTETNTTLQSYYHPIKNRF